MLPCQNKKNANTKNHSKTISLKNILQHVPKILEPEMILISVVYKFVGLPWSKGGRTVGPDWSGDFWYEISIGPVRGLDFGTDITWSGLGADF